MSAAVAAAASEPQRSILPGPSPRQGTRRKRGQQTGSGRSVLAPWQVNLATTIMRGNLTSGLSVAELARLCRLSLCYFVRAFSRTMGVTPYAWYMQQRIARADELLIHSDMPLAHVALDCGFSDQAHFSNAFAKATGTTPARRRREGGAIANLLSERSSAIDRSIGSGGRKSSLTVNTEALANQQEKPAGTPTVTVPRW